MKNIYLTNKNLSNEEILLLFSNFNKENRKKLIEGNLDLVYLACTKYNILKDDEDLISVGIIGLINAIDTYDISKDFNNYALTCIEKEILLYKKYLKHNNFKFDVIEKDIFDNIEDRIVVINALNKLSLKERNIIEYYFGFKDNHTYTIEEIADTLNTTKVHIQSVLNLSLYKLKKILPKKNEKKLIK